MHSSDLSTTLRTLEKLESLFHAACAEATTADFERIVAPDFWEIGASGKAYTREFALSTLINRTALPSKDMWITKNNAIKQIDKNVFLLTYTLIQPGRITQRITVWHLTNSGWQAVFHQGTIVSD